MRPDKTAVFCAGLALTFLGSAAVAEVRISLSNDPNAGFAGELRSLLETERAALNATAPRAALGPDASPRPRHRPGADTGTGRYDAAWLAAMPTPTGGPHWQCLTEAIYFEARGETLRGQFAVAEVILNRVESSRYPDNVCAVVRQGAGSGKGCQFSYVCDGRPEVIADRAAWERAGKIARLMLDGSDRPLTEGATHFHTVAVRPLWSRIYERTARIGAHLFYRQTRPAASGATPAAPPVKPAATGNASVTASTSGLRTRDAVLAGKGRLDMGL